MLYFIFEGNFPRGGGGGGLYLKRRFNGGFFALPVCGTYIWRGLYMEGHILGILRYAAFQKKGEKSQLRWRHIPSVRSLYACSLNQFFFVVVLITIGSSFPHRFRYSHKTFLNLCMFYRRRANFTIKPRFENEKVQSFASMNFQGSGVERNIHWQRVQNKNAKDFAYKRGLEVRFAFRM